MSRRQRMKEKNSYGESLTNDCRLGVFLIIPVWWSSMKDLFTFS
jgi:hypothetical protein